MNDHRKLKVLFLCTGNSARSILAEFLLRSMDDRFTTHSAGAAPTGRVHPLAEKVLRDVYGIDAADAESQSWEVFSGFDFDFIIMVCDHARDTCPLWPESSTIRVHWGLPDPAAHAGDDEDVESLFRHVADLIQIRLERLCELPIERLARGELIRRLQAIGEEPASEVHHP